MKVRLLCVPSQLSAFGESPAGRLLLTCATLGVTPVMRHVALLSLCVALAEALTYYLTGRHVIVQR